MPYSKRNVDVLGEDDPLKLDDEEVDQLLDVVGEALKRGLVDRVVLAGADLSSETIAKGSLADDFGCGGN